MKKLILVLFSIVFSLSANAQNRSISGVVTDSESGDPIPGVTVLVVGTNIGDATSREGEYSIQVPEGNNVLRFSSIGYTTLDEQIGNRNIINVEMESDVAMLDDVVVSGYSAVPRREITGSLSQVSGRDIGGLDIQSPDQALQGRIAGARVSNLSGQPGGSTYIRIRGIGSINAGNSPLYIVDGVPISDVDRSGTLGSSSASNALNAINPRDIESIEVLKDAAAAAIYGAQAANGVILITTRRGSAGETQFNLSANYGISEELNRIDIIEGPEWVELQYEAFEWWGEFNNNSSWEAIAANNIGGWTLQDVADGNVPHYDWQDALMRTGTTQRYDLSASGGNDETRFFISGGYNNSGGVAIGTDFDRMNLRANIDHQANDKLSFELNLNTSFTEQNGALQEGFYSGSPFFAGQWLRPTDPIYNEDGSFAESSGGGYNPVAANELDTRNSTQKQLIGNVSALYSISEHLNFRSNWGLDYRTTEDIDYRAPESPAGSALGGYRFDANRNVTNFTTNQVVNFFNTFSDVHRVRALGGFEYRREARETFSASGQGFPSGLFRTLQNAAEPLSVTGFGSEYRIASFLSRVQYDYDDTYLTNVSVRYDGSSRFGEDRRWGLFYAGSLGWRISNNSFMDFSNSWLDELKLRVGYGITGNSSISNFASRQLFTSGGAYNNNPALTPSGLGNNLLTWEESATINVGLDWELLKSRIYGSLDIYSRENSKLLLDRELPSDSGFGSLTENAGRVQNQGIELEIGAVVVDRGGFLWSSDINITWQRNELLELNEGADRIGSSYFVGRPLTEYYMYRYAGVNPADGRPMFEDRNGNITYTPTTASEIENDDRQFVGDSFPESFGGWFNEFNYKGFQLDVLFQYNFGQTSYNSFTGSFTDGAFFRRNGLIENSRNRWTEPGQITSVERAYVNSSYPGRTTGFTTSSRFLENASYIRLKNVQFAYQIPGATVQRIGLRNARVFVQATNLVTWTEYNGIDPEVVGTNNAIYPQSRTLTTGIEIGF
jgi:TonB-linked SusC/RagA family outer membrane protein